MTQTPLTVGALIHHALLTAGLSTTNVMVDMVLGEFPHVSILQLGGQQYTRRQADSLAEALGLTGIDRRGGQGIEEPYGLLTGTTETGLGITIHCEPDTTTGETTQ